MDWADLRATAFDFETTATLPEYALQPWRAKTGDFSLTSLAVYPDHTLATGLYPTREKCRVFLTEAKRNKRTIVGWNVVFDIMCMLALDLEPEVMACRWLDGMLVWKHAVVEPEYEMTRNQKQHFKLKGPGGVVSVLWPGQEDYGEGIDFHDPTPAARAILQTYNEADTRYTHDAAQHWWGQLTERQQGAALIEAECLPLVAAANLRGMTIDTLACRSLQAKLTAIADAKLKILGPVGVTEKVVRSPKQLKKVLFEDWGCPVIKTNVSKKTGNESSSTDKETLHELALLAQAPGCNWAAMGENVTHIHEYRQALNGRAKFADNPLKAVDYNADGCARPQAFVFSTYSGRLTYGSTQGRNKDERQIGWAIHQEKRDKEYRDIVIAPPGYTLVEFDAAGQEYRWMGVQSGDETMLDLCRPGQDPHSFMGANFIEMDYKTFLVQVRAENLEFTGPRGHRMMGKVGNLSLQYRTSARRLCSTARTDYDLLITMPEAERLHAVYQRSYPRVPIFWRRQIDLAKAQGYVETLAGRRVKVQGDWRGSFGWAMGSTAINYVIQGTGADQKYLALAVLRPYLSSIAARFLLDMHDGLYFLIPDEKVAEALPRIKAMLDNLPYQGAWGMTPPIPMPWDAKTGRSWGQLKNWKEAA